MKDYKIEEWNINKPLKRVLYIDDEKNPLREFQTYTRLDGLELVKTIHGWVSVHSIEFKQKPDNFMCKCGYDFLEDGYCPNCWYQI